jgi:hypothetical protein
MNTARRHLRSLLSVAVLLAAAAAASAQGASSACPALLQHTMPRLQDGKPQPLCQYAGKVLLVVIPPASAASRRNTPGSRRCTPATRRGAWW